MINNNSLEKNAFINWENNFKSQQKSALTFILGRFSVISVLVCTEVRKKWHWMVETHNRHRVLTTTVTLFFFYQGLISSELRRILEKRPSSRSSEEIHYVSLLIYSSPNIVILYVFWLGLRATSVLSNPKTNIFPHAALVRESGKTHFVFVHAFCLWNTHFVFEPMTFFLFILSLLMKKLTWAQESIERSNQTMDIVVSFYF